ncbi:magnesium transporter [Roseospirillum parvum]|uniref:Magnesium transporter MgtE n=1 Tax=Roseospirillum parvum TaxID=83401 RepID=A0A1G7WWS8_9PROT|nr:magnesium transporter [Roseospirillum parvum]SDG76393.1 magnesium transporter [Roseospirillum parvum]
MADHRLEASPQAPDDESAEVFGLGPDFIDMVVEGLDNDHAAAVSRLVSTLHHADLADLIERLSRDQRARLLEMGRDSLNYDFLPELDETVRDEVVELMGFADLAAALADLDSDDAVYIVENLGQEERDQVLARLPGDQRMAIEHGLAFEEDTAGRLMQRELVAVPSYWTVGETIDYLRSNARLPDEFYQLFVVDPRHRPIGTVRLSRLLRCKRPTRLGDIMDPNVPVIASTTDQEDVAFLFRQRDLLSAPVIDPSGRLIGRITIDDIVDVIDEEAEDDMLRMAGLSETHVYETVYKTTKSRFLWLIVNLGTAVLASLVIGLFESTIQQVVALAVLMPIVASMGGNAGTQTMTVAVRALATRELAADNALRLIGKEALVGLLNGVMLAVISGAVAWAWFGRPEIGLVIGAAMVINLVGAGLAGILIPLGLEKLKVDPALASGVFLTTVTDVVGFFAFLGLAALVLL